MAGVGGRRRQWEVGGDSGLQWAAVGYGGLRWATVGYSQLFDYSRDGR